PHALDGRREAARRRTHARSVRAVAHACQRGLRAARRTAALPLSLDALHHLRQPSCACYAGCMATPLHREPAAPSAPNASDFAELYAFERPAPALPVDQFLEEMRALIRQHPVEDGLATALRYGTGSREALRRWIKDYYQFIRWDAQGTAAMIA